MRLVCSILIVWVIIGMSLLACTDKQNTQDPITKKYGQTQGNFYGVSETERAERIDEIIYHGLDLGLKGNETKDGIINTLGNPKELKLTKVPNKHYPAELIDETYELFYDGLSLKIYHVTYSNKDFITDISLSGENYAVKWGLGIGSTKSKIIEILGAPKKVEKDLLGYESMTGAPSQIYFHFQNDTVNKIEWHYYLD